MERCISIAVGLALLVGTWVVPARAAEDPAPGVVDEILGILRDRGLVDEAQYERLTRDYAESQRSLESRLPKLRFFGDFRARHESFWYDEDDLGNERDNRYRGRYRIRVGAVADVNDHASVIVRFATGADRDSTNQTLGDGVDDGFFDPDEIFVDRAYVRIRPFLDEPFPGGSVSIDAGRVPNPYVGKVAKDILLWDHDIVLEGASLQVRGRAGDSTELYGNTGYYVIEENSSSKDPHLFAGQAGFVSRLAEAFSVGVRASGFFFDSLNGTVNSGGVFCPDSSGTMTDFSDSAGESFMCRAAANGNILAGLTGDPLGGDMTVGELRGHATWTGHETWPVTVFATAAQNFDAESVSGTGAGKEDVAFGFGIETGSKKEFVKLGVGYFHIEANAFPGMFIDSDLFDGRTNRKGFVVYGSRQLWGNTDLNLTFFSSDEIENEAIFMESVADAERYRLQTDVVFKF